MSKTLKMITKAELTKQRKVTKKQITRVTIFSDEDVISYFYDRGLLCNITNGTEWHLFCCKEDIPRIFRAIKQIEKRALPKLIENYYLVLVIRRKNS